MTNEIEDFLTRKTREHGEKFDASDLVPKFAPFFRTGQRIRVQDQRHPEMVRTGTIGVTTGWKPAFLLMHRSSDRGSSDVLGVNDVITHIQHGRTYVPVANLSRDPNKKVSF